MASKSVSPDLNPSSPRFDIVDYFDSVINQIDIDAEMKIASHEKNRNGNSIESLKQINVIRNKYLEKIKQIQAINLDNYDRYKENCDSMLKNLKKSEKVKRNKILLKKFAFYLNSQSIQNYSKNILGLLIVLDWYLSEDDLSLLM